MAKTLDKNLKSGPNAKAVHFEVFTDGNQLRIVNAPSFVLHIWLNEGDRAQTALSIKMSMKMKIMVTGVRIKIIVAKYKKVIKLGRLWIKDEIFSELNGMMLFNGKSSNHLIKYLFNAFF